MIAGLNQETVLTLVVLAGYLLGSIPFGLLLTRAAGLGDVRKIGSGSIGATNVLRTGRKGLAAATVLLDGLKGSAAVLLGAWLGGVPGIFLGGIASLLGHCYPVWLKFRGGKGIATALGILVVADWRVAIAAAAAWLLVALLLRISSAAALAAVVVAPIAAWALGSPQPVLGLVLVADALILLRHKDNIQRLLAGTEPRIGQKK
jgi:glycerol-3-phosphate acyltransferase PlsY